MVGLGGWEFPEQGWRKGPWTSEEDKLLTEYVSVHGEGRWSRVSKSAGLNRNNKSCRLRWVNYLRPGLKRGQLTAAEERTIRELNALWGNKWSMIARCLPGRTDNAIKNYWRTHIKPKFKTPRAEERPTRVPTWRFNQKQPQEQGQRFYQQQPQLSDDMNNIQCEYGVLPEEGSQEMHFMFPNMDEHFFSTVLQHGVSSSDGVGVGEEGLWGSLWNMDDLNLQFNHMYDSYKVSKPAF